MKTFIIVCATLLLAAMSVRGNFEVFKNIARDCGTQENVNVQDIIAFYKYGIVTDAQKMGCFNACTLERADILTNGKINTDPLMAAMEQMNAANPEMANKFKQVIGECVAKVTSQERCEMSLQLVKCAVQILKQ